ncbi:hypothetical protein PDE_05843 [Penicillium oxalicum 114-2]|uniref:Uncharacterized protein n=1 Tax=Penicillium oxalicum (strain 114-2 / CGMCC 5302) TaxID=933388 RepID=S7ZJV6_PENO1|nr:hypothetical protein PDE_05843 [Penicillium oxalicum 114-2]
MCTALPAVGRSSVQFWRSTHGRTSLKPTGSRFTRRTRQKAPDFDQEQTIFPNCECLLAIIPTGIQHYVNLCSLSIGTTERIGEVRLSIRIKSQCSDQGPPNRLSYTQYLSLDYSYQSVSVSISVTETPHILGRETKPHGCAGGLFLVRSTLMPGTWTLYAAHASIYTL